MNHTVLPTDFPTPHTWNPSRATDDNDDDYTTPGLPPAPLDVGHTISQVYEEMTTLLAGDQTEVVIHEQDNELTSIILIAVIVAALVVFLCVLVVVRYSLKHKGSYYTQEDKEGHWGDADDTMLKAGHSFQDLDEDV